MISMTPTIVAFWQTEWFHLEAATPGYVGYPHQAAYPEAVP